MRNPALARTGAGALALAMASAGYGNGYRLPAVSRRTFAVAGSSSWSSTTPLAPNRVTPEGDETAVLRGVITTLLGHISLREGHLQLTAVAPAMSSLRDPAAGWQAVFDFLTSNPGIRERIAGITIAQRHPGPTGRPAESRVELPAGVYRQLGITTWPANGTWTIGEYQVGVPRSASTSSGRGRSRRTSFSGYPQPGDSTGAGYRRPPGRQ